MSPRIDEKRTADEMDLPEDKVAQAVAIMEDAIREHDPSSVVGMFSGGHDSLCATHLASTCDRFIGAFHANTGIGIEATRDFVRQTCQEQGWNLFERRATDPSYEDLVLERGFPKGPQSHNTMLYYLKQQQWDAFVQEIKQEWHGRSAWKDRIMLVTGIRVAESNRRTNAEMSDPWVRQGAKLWVNPILYWDKLDENRYIENAGLHRNPVVDSIHKSGECLCGALANPHELAEIEEWFPGAADRIYELEKKAEAKGLVDCRWAYKSQAPGRRWDEVHESEVDTQMCMSCVQSRKPMPPT